MTDYIIEGTSIAFPSEGLEIDISEYEGDSISRLMLSRGEDGKLGISFERPPEICIEIPPQDITVEKTGEADDAGIEQIKRIVNPPDMSRLRILPCAEKGMNIKPEFTREQLDGERKAMEEKSGGKNTIIEDDLGRPSVMVRIPKFKWSDVYDGGSDETFPAFIIDGKDVDCIYISKYLNVVEYGRAYSLPGQDPANSITVAEAHEVCQRKGRGWHLLTNAEWCAIAHYCEKHGIRPGGNNEKGRDFHSHEAGTPSMGGHRINPSITERTLTGSGPDSWTHDGTPYGIYDLTGNVWEHVAGLRLVDGEIQIIKDNDSALCVDESSSSPLWRAIDTEGRLVIPGSPLTYKYDSLREGSPSQDIAAPQGGFRISTEVTHPQYTGKEACRGGGYSIMPFRDLIWNNSEPTYRQESLEELIKLGLFPVGNNIPEHLFFMRNYGERMPQRGGSWYDLKFSGLWELYIRDGRDYVYPDMGFRSAFIKEH